MKLCKGNDGMAEQVVALMLKGCPPGSIDIVQVGKQARNDVFAFGIFPLGR